MPSPGPIVFELGGFTTPTGITGAKFKVTTVSVDEETYPIDQGEFILDIKTPLQGELTIESLEATDTRIYSSSGKYKIKFKA